MKSEMVLDNLWLSNIVLYNCFLLTFYMWTYNCTIKLSFFKFLRLCNEDSVDACFELMKKYWRIMEPHQPNLVISVVGGAKNFRLDGDMRDTFSHGLIKVVTKYDYVIDKTNL